MRYGSVCSGIGTDALAWHPLGWETAFFAQYDPQHPTDTFAADVLAYHYPNIPNLGDFTKIGEEHGPIDLLAGGTPCQSFSVAGKRLGMDDPRGNLAIEFLRLAQRLRPRWLVWENVPGVLSSSEGRDFGAFLDLMGQCGYGWAYRVLDAQYFGVAQRRRRVFVVGYFGDWRPAHAVLFERTSLQRHPAPSRSPRQIAPTIPASGVGTGRTGNERTEADFLIDPDIFHSSSHGGYAEGFRTLRHSGGDIGDGSEMLIARRQATSNQRNDYETETLVVAHENKSGNLAVADHARTVRSGASHSYQFVAAFSAGAGAKAGSIGYKDEQSPTLKAAASGNNQVPTIAFTSKDFGGDAAEELAPTMRGGGHGSSHPNSGTHIGIVRRSQVRRLTPRECERLQGLPDDYTKIPYKGRPAEQCPDGPRYRAIGNGWAMPVAQWVGRRIDLVDRLLATSQEAR